MENGLIKHFKPNSIINWDDQTKKLILLGNIEKEQAIMIVNKKAFEKQENQFEFQNAEQYFANDIYTKYTLLQEEKLECELIYPARQSHIDKYSKSEIFIENETYDDFLNQKQEQMPIEWVYNILEKKKEVENILYENQEFLILKDYVFVNSKNIDDLHLLALPFRRDIKSLRDLKGEHIEMLEEMQERGLEQIKEKYGLEPQNVKIFIHYLPSFYHFHVHFTHSSSQGQPFRDHPLNQVIQNLKIKDNYYQHITLQYVTKKRINSSQGN